MSELWDLVCWARRNLPQIVRENYRIRRWFRPWRQRQSRLAATLGALRHGWNMTRLRWRMRHPTYAAARRKVKR